MANDTLSKSPPKIISRELSEKPVSILPPLVSLVIPCCGMKEYTQMCVASIFNHTRMPYELIFLDVGSLDGTEDLLTGIKLALRQVRVEIVRTPTDLGIPAACREALERCRGEYVVLLNNDTIVTRSWINKMTALLEAKDSLGMVGPMSNYAGPPQLVETVSYRSGPRKQPRPGEETAAPRGLVDADAVQTFADEFQKQNQGKWTSAERLHGFCLMLRRELIKKFDQQGNLSKWTDLGIFDTDILSTKTKQLGYNLGVCQDLFIHHFGTRTFAHGAPSTAGTTGNAGTTPPAF